MFIRKIAGLAVTAALLGQLLMGLTPASALPPSPGANVAFGYLYATGWTTSPVTSTPDPAQWHTWPSRAWYLELPNVLHATGTVHGWCDESKGQGAPHSYFDGYEGIYFGGIWGTSAGLRSIRWTGTGRTLTITADIHGYAMTPLLFYAEQRGTLVGTLTLFTEATLSELCFDGVGVQQPIPVVFTWTYVLNS